mmetsp:Transcript_38125/g.67076  ORF Transcript_38125/g.67076 Transcript_38125/m.67076 type:complete len:113 (+) Transcript_38125:634-972(+)
MMWYVDRCLDKTSSPRPRLSAPHPLKFSFLAIIIDFFEGRGRGNKLIGGARQVSIQRFGAPCPLEYCREGVRLLRKASLSSCSICHVCPERPSAPHSAIAHQNLRTTRKPRP